MSEREIKKSGVKAISPIDVYKLLPRTNCKECGEENCMAFAAKVVNREVEVELCTPLLTEKHKDSYEKLLEMLRPPVREVVIGRGERTVKVGGKLVMYRHEFTYSNPTAIAIDITDEMTEEEIARRVGEVERFNYDYIGRNLKLDLVALRSTSNNPENFHRAVEKVLENTILPLILCSYNPEVMEAGLKAAAEERPLIYAATQDNWREMAELALSYKCPLAIYAPNDVGLLKSLVKTVRSYGVEDLALDPGTFTDQNMINAINDFTMIRRAVFRREDDLLGHPLIGIPMVVWNMIEESIDISKWKEAYLASTLITRYADLLIMHSMDGWVLLPLVVLRDNLYTDPRKPVAVETGLKVFGDPNEDSPVMFTTNFALTYYTVASDIESGKISCYLIVIDTGGISVESAVAGRHLTAGDVAEAIKEMGVEERVKHRKLIIPGRAARLSGEIEELSSWEVLVGPLDSSGIPRFLSEKWPAEA